MLGVECFVGCRTRNNKTFSTFKVAIPVRKCWWKGFCQIEPRNSNSDAVLDAFPKHHRWPLYCM